MVKAGANANLKTRGEELSLIMATNLSNTYEIIKLLIDTGADVNTTDSDSNTVLSKILESV